MILHARDTEPRAIPSLYFSAAYGIANAEHLGGRWVTVADDAGTWQMPLIIRKDETGVIDAATPYGYGGIFISRSMSDRVLRAAWGSARSLLEDMGIVSVFLRFAPFLTNSSERARELDGLDVRQTSHTIAVPVLDADAMWTAMKGRARTAIRKATAQGLTANIESISESILSADDPFRVLYASTMDRLGAGNSYYFGESYYRYLSAAAANQVQVASVRDATGRVVAAALVLCDDTVAHYHLSGSDPVAARDGANNLLIWSIMKWSAEQGYHSVHLGGGVRPEDTLFRFKDSFGGTHLPFRVGRLVVDEKRYHELVAARASQLRCDPADLVRADYFPAYRSEPKDAS
ncbi:GNAT family N-acetyltransferase [Microbacterium sp. I2]|uniref:GNAT family N-acetyltransferase n=1 Tax=Microbacterium sp. I2 TaxID=3391826 RepID=UPI003EDAF4F4